MYKQVTLEQLVEMLKNHPVQYVFIEMTTEKHGVELVFPVEKYTATAIINAAVARSPENKDEKVTYLVKENNFYFGPY